MIFCKKPREFIFIAFGTSQVKTENVVVLFLFRYILSEIVGLLSDSRLIVVMAPEIFLARQVNYKESEIIVFLTLHTLSQQNQSKKCLGTFIYNKWVFRLCELFNAITSRACWSHSTHKVEKQDISASLYYYITLKKDVWCVLRFKYFGLYKWFGNTQLTSGLLVLKAFVFVWGF